MSLAKKARVLTTLSLLTSTRSLSMSSFVETLRASKIVNKEESIPSGLGAEKLIGTHDGSFHCDEALAVSMLKLLPQYSDAVVVRTRNPELLAKCGIVVDVGAVYDADTNRFDHHQREFTGTLSYVLRWVN